MMKYCACLLLVFRMDVVVDRGTKPVALFRMMIMMHDYDNDGDDHDADHIWLL